MDDDEEFTLTYADREKIAQLLQRYQNLSSDSPLSSATRCFSIDSTSPTFITELFQELETVDVDDLTKEGSAKNFANFLIELSEIVPIIVLENINHLLIHLDGECYTLRNAVLTILSELIERRLKGEQLASEEKQIRDKFLHHLEEHIHDKNAFVRSKVLQLWVRLAETKTLPLSRLRTLLPLIVGRLVDKASTVRKAAVHFLTAILKGNPFMSEFKVDDVKTKYESENAKLEQMLASKADRQSMDEDGRLVANAEASWRKLEPRVEPYIDQWLEEHCEDQMFNTSADLDAETPVDLILRTIYRMLCDAKYLEACSFLVVTQVHYPQHRVFVDWTANGDNIHMESMRSSILESLKTVFLEHTVALAMTIGNAGGDDDLSESIASGSDDMDFSQRTSNTQANTLSQKAENAEIIRQRQLVSYLKNAYTFAEQLLAVLPQVSAMLRQQQTSDVLEAIEFVITCHEFGIAGSRDAFWECCRLIWSKEQIVKDAVIRTFQRLFLSVDAGEEGAKEAVVAKNLISLTVQADLSQLTSLEEIICEMTKRQSISPDVCRLFWEYFSMRFAGGNTYEESKAALKLIGMMAKAEKSIIRDNIDIVIEFGLGNRASKDFELAADACYALQKLSLMPKAKAEEALKIEPCRFADDHHLFTRLQSLIVDGYTRLEDLLWTPMTERAIQVVFCLADHPNEIAANVLKNVLEKFRREKSTDSGDKLLLRLFALIGQVAVQSFINLDVAVCRELKRRSLLNDEMRADQLTKARKKRQESSPSASTSRSKKLPVKTPRSKVSTVTSFVTPTVDLRDDELSAMVGSSADDQEYEFVSRLCEEELLSDSSILGQLAKIVLLVCQNPQKYRNEEILTAASLALSKLMLVSSKFADENMRLFFTLMDRSESAAVRANLVIAVGDLSFRFPNLVEPWTATVYQRLHDRDLNVRLNCLLILNHLILNDMIKPKGFVADIALCTLDGSNHVANLAKKFFVEYAEKGNSLYNLFPDIISRLSDPESKVEFDDFKSILKFLFSLIHKERQFESLVDKLCQRFVISKSLDQWRRLSYCLTLPTYNERCLRKLQENVSCYAMKLGDGEIFTDFMTILNAAKKACKQESKELLDEFEGKVMGLHKKYDEGGGRNVTDVDVEVKPRREAKTAKTPRRRRCVSNDTGSPDYSPPPSAVRGRRRNQS